MPDKLWTGRHGVKLFYQFQHQGWEVSSLKTFIVGTEAFIETVDGLLQILSAIQITNERIYP